MTPMRILLVLLITAGTAFGRTVPGSPASALPPDPAGIIARVDANLTSRTRIFQSEMTVHGARTTRTITSRTVARGNRDAFTTYLSPAREKGNKMLKLKSQLWIYSRTADRTIRISGHMLRQSVLGSDLSYEDMMEVRNWSRLYTPVIKGEETYRDRKTWVIDLNAKVEDVAYARCRVWVDQERFVPLKEELFAKSGRLLKTTFMDRITRIRDRWFPMKVTFRDMLRKGKGTDFTITEIRFDADIPDHVFSKASLRK